MIEMPSWATISGTIEGLTVNPGLANGPPDQPKIFEDASSIEAVSGYFCGRSAGPGYSLPLRPHLH